MPNRHRQFRVLRFLVILFLSSLTFCLWLNQVPFTALQTRWGELATAQPPNASLLVQQGIEQYRVGNLQEAIASWQTALSAYENTNNHDNAAIVREKLAIGYQQIRQVGNIVKVGRLLTELAQTNSRLGQNREAIALLCGASETDEKCLKRTI